jgi:transcription elongation factor Elf1
VKINGSDGMVYLSPCRNIIGLGGKMGLGKEKRKVPNSRIKVLTKDAKQMVNGPYYCPKCRRENLQILADLKNKRVYASCRCGLEWPLTYAPVFQPIDYYNKFRDAWKKQSYGIIKPK